MNIMYTTKYQNQPAAIMDCLYQIPEEAISVVLSQFRTATYGDKEVYDKFTEWCNADIEDVIQCEECFDTFIKCMNKRLSEPIRFGAWLAPLDFILNRNYTSQDLYKEDKPVLRCFLGDNFIRICDPLGMFMLFGFSELPKLQPDPLVNNKLITKAELDELKQYEKQEGKQLAKTTTKKDVLHILKMARNGLLGSKKTIEVEKEAADFSFEDRIRSLL